jgi:hypothetical protein
MADAATVACKKSRREIMGRILIFSFVNVKKEKSPAPFSQRGA